MSFLERVKAEQLSRWEREVVLASEWPDYLRELRIYAITTNQVWTEGVHTFSLKKEAMRWLVPYYVVPGPLTAYEVAGALARALNRMSSHPRGRARHVRRDWERIQQGDVWHYYLVRPGWYDNAYMVDVRSAYYQIYSMLLTWDIAYWPCEFFGWGEVAWPDGLLTELGKDRALRNALIGVAGSTWGYLYWPDGSVSRYPVTGCTNYQLVLFVLDYLQCAMHDAHRRFRRYTVYANTDCLVVTGGMRIAVALQEYWREFWGLDSKIKAQGRCHIKDIGAYAFFDDGELLVKSGHYDHVRERPKADICHTRGINDIVEWMKQKVVPRLGALERR